MHLRKIKRFLFQLTHPVIGEVWMLHRVTDSHSDTELQRTYEITPSRLESVIVKYQQKGYEFVSIAEAVDRISKISMSLHHTSTHRFICITLDDGYADNYYQAYPIFKKYNVPFCIYLLKNEVLGYSNCLYPMLNEEQILRLDKEPLCTLGGHTCSHPRLETLKKEEQYQEIVSCKNWMENLLGHKLLDYSYPYGSFSQDTIDILAENGIIRCTMAWGGKVRKGQNDSLKIPRLLVTETNIL